jgi:hypothetical protein
MSCSQSSMILFTRTLFTDSLSMNGSVDKKLGQPEKVVLPDQKWVEPA